MALLLVNDEGYLFSSVEFSRETEELEQEHAALDVGWILPQFGAQCLDGFVEIAGFKEVACRHSTSPDMH